MGLLRFEIERQGLAEEIGKPAPWSPRFFLGTVLQILRLDRFADVCVESVIPSPSSANALHNANSFGSSSARLKLGDFHAGIELESNGSESSTSVPDPGLLQM